MYTLKINEDGSVTTAHYETIMQRSNLVDNFQILASPTYRGIDLSDFNLTMKFLLPVSKRLNSITLTLTNANYDGFLQYVVKGTTLFTAEAGDIEVFFSFTKLTQNEDGSFNQLVRETQKGIVHITSIPDWGNIVPDDALTALDQRMIALEALIKQLDSLQQATYTNMVNDLKLDIPAKELYLISQTGRVGEGVDVDKLSELIGEYVVGSDLDGVNDGVTHLDDIGLPNVTITNLDDLV